MHVRFPPDFRTSPATQSGPALVLSAATTTPEGIARAIAIQQTTGEAFRAPLFRALLSDQIAFAVLGTGQSPPLADLERTGRPSLIVLVDDDDTTRLGPEGWPRATRALRWARSVMLHGSGGKPEHYELAVQGARGGGRLLLVETSSAQIKPWLRAATRFLPPARVLVIAPPNGEAHPVPLAKEAVQ